MGQKRSSAGCHLIIITGSDSLGLVRGSFAGPFDLYDKPERSPYCPRRHPSESDQDAVRLRSYLHERGHFVERRLAAIMAADAVGYSRMMREDEAGALTLLHKHRSEVIDPGIAKHRGRIVKLMGDGLLAEFSSVVEAVDCAAEIQRAMAARNGGSQGERQMAFRVGVHLGDIIVEGDDLYGDGVNIASRLEGIAERGGICISRQAYDQVQKKLALGYRSLGPKNLKNIPDPIEAFAIQGDGLAIADEPANSLLPDSR